MFLQLSGLSANENLKQVSKLRLAKLKKKAELLADRYFIHYLNT